MLDMTKHNPPTDTTDLSVAEEQGFPTPVIVTGGTSETWARHEVPVLASLGLRAAAVTDLSASLARLLSPVLDVLIRLWLAEGFLVADVMEHMLGDQAIHAGSSPAFGVTVRRPRCHGLWH